MTRGQLESSALTRSFRFWNGSRCFAFVARKAASKTDNQCHVFAKLESDQPATAIVNFVAKVLMTSSTASANHKIV